MASEVPVGSSSLLLGKRGPKSVGAEWPKGTAFHEESGAFVQASTYRACAREFAKQVAPDERSVYQNAIAGEATKRVLRLHLFKQQERELLVGYPHADFCTQAEATHGQRLRLEIAWEREKHRVQRGEWGEQRWHWFHREPRFVLWMQSVARPDLNRWALKHLPHQTRFIKADDLRGLLARVRPLPEAIRKRYFFENATDQEVRAQAGAETRLDVLTEHHVARVCQRLIALHTLRNAKRGPSDVAFLESKLIRQNASNILSTTLAADQFSYLQESEMRIQRRVAYDVAQTVTERVHQAVATVQGALQSAAGIRELLWELTPDRLVLEEVCPFCEHRNRLVEQEETSLPPYHPVCECFRLTWRSTQMGEFDRCLMLWACECALRPNPTPRFPLMQFIDACEALAI
jgi:hypothetical protein